MDIFMPILAQSDSGGSPIAMLFWLAVVAIVVASMWKVFQKAGQPGWGVLVPIYNLFLLCKIAGRPAWWLVLFFIPVINIVMAFILAMDVAKAFGKSAGFGIGLALLGFIFYPILAFGSARYQGSPSGQPRGASFDSKARAA